MRLPSPPRRRAAASNPESGQISLLILGCAVVVILLIVGTVGVTSVELSRIRLLDAADGAALDAADALDATAYEQGIGRSVPLSDASVRTAAASYLELEPLPTGVLRWRLAPGTGSPDGRSARVRLTAVVEVPLVGGVIQALAGPVTITVESRARAVVL
jgi:hypothetical protein